jgi:hypothetical protein
VEKQPLLIGAPQGHLYSRFILLSWPTMRKLDITLGPRSPHLWILVCAALFVFVACSDASENGDEVETPDIQIEQAPSNTPVPAPSPTAAEPDPTPTVIASESAEPVATPEPEPEATATQVPESPSESDPAVSIDLPDAAFLDGMAHMYQTFNNCSAASVCMLLSHYDVVYDQETLRPIMRPNDGTRHGKYEYMVQFFNDQGFEAPLMHGGDVDTLRAFIANDIPVIVQQWLDPDADPIGHYSVVRGYDHSAGIFRLNDSMHGEDYRIGYDQFIDKWRAFSYRYIPVYPPEQQETVDRILGDQTDRNANRKRTLDALRAELEHRPNDAELIYAIGTNLYDLGRFQEAIEAYEQAASIGLPPKMLWYVYWPAAAYYELGRHQDAIGVAEAQITSAQTFGDMRYERARAFEALGQIDLAIAEYNQALKDDPKLRRAEDALIRLGAL